MRKLPWFLLLAVLPVLPAHGGDTFTLAIIPDVQMETSGPRFEERLKWLVANREAMNIKLMLQVGDLMNFNDEAQYTHQSEGLKVLDDAKFPYAACIGNHDSAAPGNVNTNLRNTSRYNKHFPVTRFKLLSGTYEAGRIDNAYQFLQCYHDPRNNPTRLIGIDTKNGSITTRVYCQSNGETKADGSSRTITGIK